MEYSDALSRLGRLENATDDGRTLYGVQWSEVVSQAIRWWDSTGRHIQRNREFQDPDVGFASGITRGLSFGLLSRREGLEVIRAYEEHILRPQYRAALQMYFERHFPELLGDEALVEWLGRDLVMQYAERRVTSETVTEPEKLN